MIITKTPYRLSFFGGGTDYNEWFEENGGLVIGSTINKYTYITMRSLPPFFDHKSRLVYSKTETVNSHDQIEHVTVRNVLNYMDINQGVEIHYDGDMPARSGIGSSSSFTVGLLKTMYAFQEKMVSNMELAKLAIHIEQDLNKENVGVQDQILASFGGLQTIELGPGKSYKVSPLILPADYIQNLESHILLGFTGIHRNSSDNAGEQKKQIKAGSIHNSMSEIHSIAREGLAALVNNSEPQTIGKLFDQTWQIKRSLTENMTNDLINQTYEKALKAGAFGGRLLGAGSGGFLVFIAPPEKHSQIKESLKEIKVWVPINFETHGSQVVFYNKQN